MAQPPAASVLTPELEGVTAYAPVPGNYRIRLDANEAPPSLSAEATAQLRAALSGLEWERYPDAGQAHLRGLVAASAGVAPERVVLGVGSDELITMLLTACARPRPDARRPVVVTATPSFVMYRLSAVLRGFQVVEVPLDAAWDLDVRGMLRAIEMMRPAVVFLASPNNPSGRVMTRERLDEVVAAASESVVVVDEAYVAYASEDRRDLLERHEHVVILRTLSKVGFASLRFGWALCPQWLADELQKVRLPYNLSGPTQAVAELVLGELGHEIARVTAEVVAERARLRAALLERPGVDVPESDANFLWIDAGVDAGRVFAELAERGVLVRSFHQRGGRLAKRLRVTVGTPAENDAFLEELDRACARVRQSG